MVCISEDSARSWLGHNHLFHKWLLYGGLWTKHLIDGFGSQAKVSSEEESSDDGSDDDSGEDEDEETPKEVKTLEQLLLF